MKRNNYFITIILLSGICLYSGCPRHNVIDELLGIKVLTVKSDGNGKTNPEGAIQTEIEKLNTIKAIPYEGYQLRMWEIEEGEAEIGNINDIETTIILKKDDVIVRAYFSLISTPDPPPVSPSPISTLEPTEEPTMEPAPTHTPVPLPNDVEMSGIIDYEVIAPGTFSECNYFVLQNNSTRDNIPLFHHDPKILENYTGINVMVTGEWYEDRLCPWSISAKGIWVQKIFLIGSIQQAVRDPDMKSRCDYYILEMDSVKKGIPLFNVDPLFFETIIGKTVMISGIWDEQHLCPWSYIENGIVVQDLLLLQ